MAVAKAAAQGPAAQEMAAAQGPFQKANDGQLSHQ